MTQLDNNLLNYQVKTGSCFLEIGVIRHRICENVSDETEHEDSSTRRLTIRNRTNKFYVCKISCHLDINRCNIQTARFQADSHGMISYKVRMRVSFI